MKAVIMAGGEGTRLRPLTSNAPKPMLPVANRPMMEHIIHLLKAHGFDEIVVTVGSGEPHQDPLRRQRVSGCHPLRRRAGAARHRRQRGQRPRVPRRDVPRHLGRRAHRHRSRQGA
ncbi:MAG: NTP transferase domain-containing protein [Acidimicrobiaceae bacterium]|nr:NTP transferase domain-containing protein [Acidimicrobiaceae bacterium]